MILYTCESTTCQIICERNPSALHARKRRPTFCCPSSVMGNACASCRAFAGRCMGSDSMFTRLIQEASEDVEKDRVTMVTPLKAAAARKPEGPIDPGGHFRKVDRVFV